VKATHPRAGWVALPSVDFLYTARRVRVLDLSFILVAVLLAGCTTSPEQEATPAPSLTPAVTAGAPTAVGSPQAKATGMLIDDDDATIVEDGFEFFAHPSDPEEFEIDADATKYVGYTPMIVDFGAKPLNGTPPFAFSWNFGDGSPAGSGERVSHTFDKTGRMDVVVEGQDATGAKASVVVALMILTPEEWAERQGLDAASLPTPTPRTP
jgi:PKD domain